MRSVAALTLIASLISVACHSDASGHPLLDAGSSSVDASDPPPDEPPLPPEDPAGWCRALVGCAAALNTFGALQGILDVVTDAYGDEGSCFQGPAAASCATQCEQSLRGYHQTYPDVPQCDGCASDSDCSPITGAVCNATTHGCFDCRVDADCAMNEAGPVCSTDQTCMQCRHDADCAAYGRKVCESWEKFAGPPGRFVCVECREDADCPAERPTCDTYNAECTDAR